MPLVEIDYAPRQWAKPFHRELTRFAVLVLHRRAGKTTCLMNHHQRAATDDAWERRRLLRARPSLSEPELKELIHPPGGRHYGHVLPFRSQAKLVVWDKLKYYASAFGDHIAINEAELLIRYPGGHKVQLFGADNPDALRGPGFSGISFDEYSQQPPNIYSEVISKSLADHLGYAVFAGTIKGKDHLYRTWEATKDDPTWFSLWQDVKGSLATEDGITIQLLKQAMADDEDQIRKGLMSQDEYDQEWFLSPTAAIKGAIFAAELAAARSQGRITRVPYEPRLPVDTDWDLGFGAKGDSTAVWFSQSLRAGEVRVIDYLEGQGEGMPHYVAKLKAKPYVYGQHWAPHDIVVQEMTGKSRLETAQALGITFQICPNIGLEDGIHAARLTMSRCWFDADKCARGLEALMHYKRDWNSRLNEFKTEPVHDWASHGADAFRYLAVRQQPPKEKAKVTYLQRPGANQSTEWMA